MSALSNSQPAGVDLARWTVRHFALAVAKGECDGGPLQEFVEEHSPIDRTDAQALLRAALDAAGTVVRLSARSLDPGEDHELEQACTSLDALAADLFPARVAVAAA